MPMGNESGLKSASMTRDHITNCNLGSVGYAGVWGCTYMCGELIWAHPAWAERSTPDSF